MEFVGGNGVGFAWSYEGGDDYDVEIEGRLNIDEVRSASLGCHEEEALRAFRWSLMPEPEDDFELEEGSFMEDLGPQRSNVDFALIVGDMVTSGLRSNDLPDNILMEIKGYKFAQNMLFGDCVAAAVPSLLHHIAEMGVSKKQFISYSMQFFGEEGRGAAILKGLSQDEDDEYG